MFARAWRERFVVALSKRVAGLGANGIVLGSFDDRISGVGIVPWWWAATTTVHPQRAGRALAIWVPNVRCAPEANRRRVYDGPARRRAARYPRNMLAAVSLRPKQSQLAINMRSDDACMAGQEHVRPEVTRRYWRIRTATESRECHSETHGSSQR